jgi:hypothetical protein
MIHKRYMLNVVLSDCKYISGWLIFHYVVILVIATIPQAKKVEGLQPSNHRKYSNYAPST